MTTIPSGALVLLVGASGAGKSTWLDTQIAAGLPATAAVRSDSIREQLFDTDEVMADHDIVFHLLHTAVRARLARGNTTVVDATNLLPDHRKLLTDIARACDAPTVAVRFDRDLDTLLVHNEQRPSPRPVKALQRHHAQMTQHGRRKVLEVEVDLVVEHTDQVRFASYGRTVRRIRSGKLAVIGDVHGTADRFAALVTVLLRDHPDAQLVSVGDINDRGPDTPGSYDVLFQHDIELVASNHGAALAKKVGPLLDDGLTAADIGQLLWERYEASRATNKPQKMTAFIAQTVRQFAETIDGTERLRRAVAAERNAPFQLLTDDRSVVVVHGGIEVELIGRHHAAAREVALYGTPSGPPDPTTGFPPDRDSWVERYNAHPDAGDLPLAVYGHIAYPLPRVTRRTVGIDTGAGKNDLAQVTAAIVEDGQLSDTVSV